MCLSTCFPGMRAGFEVRRVKPHQCLRTTVESEITGKFYISGKTSIIELESKIPTPPGCQNKVIRDINKASKRQAVAEGLGAVQSDNPSLL